MNAKSAKNPKTRTVITVGFVLILLSGGVFASGALEPKIVWSPPTINLASLKPGETLTATAVFTNASLLNQKLDGNLSFAIANPNGATITATAKFPKSVKSGEKVPVTLKISVASSTPALPPRVISGNVRLVKIGGKTKDDKLGKLFEKSLGVNIAISSIPLPPFPDKAEDIKTILGLDVGKNGIPDRVEWFIANAAPDSEKKRMAMMLSAKSQQNFFKDYLAHLGENPNDPLVIARVRGMADVGSKTYNCQRYVFGAITLDARGDEGMATVEKNIKETQALYMDTPERIRAFWKSEKPLVATSAPNVQPEQYKQQCLDLNFDPDSFPN